MQTRKLHTDQLAAERPILEAQGWQYAGPMASRPDMHRFTREGEESAGDAVTLEPHDTYVKIRHRLEVTTP